MTCPIAPSHKPEPLQSPFLCSQRVRRRRRSCHCPSALQRLRERGKKKRHRAKKIAFIGIIHTPSRKFPTHHRLNHHSCKWKGCWQLRSQPCQMLTCKKGHKHLCVPEGEPCPARVFTTPAVKYDPSQKFLRVKKGDIFKASHFTQSPHVPLKSPFCAWKSSNRGDMFKYVALLFPLLRSQWAADGRCLLWANRACCGSGSDAD